MKRVSTSTRSDGAGEVTSHGHPLRYLAAGTG